MNQKKLLLTLNLCLFALCGMISIMHCVQRKYPKKSIRKSLVMRIGSQFILDTPQTVLESITKLYDGEISQRNIINALKNALGEKLLSEIKDNNNGTVLHYICNKGTLDILDIVLKAADSDLYDLLFAQNNTKETALHRAAQRESHDDPHMDAKMVEALLDAAGAARAAKLVNTTDNGKDTPLHWAIIKQGEHEDVVNAILHHHSLSAQQRQRLVFLQDDMLSTVLHMACNNRHIRLNTVKSIISAAGDKAPELIDLKGHNGKTALDYARGQKRSDIVNYLEGIIEEPAAAL